MDKPRNTEQMTHYMDGYNSAIENCARLAQALIIIRSNDKDGADAAYDIITRAVRIDGLREFSNKKN